MDTNELLIAKRAQERLLALAIAGGSIVLGFLLFLFVPDAPSDGSANIEWMDKKMMLANIGPGVFFALFGAVITVYSIVTQAKSGPAVVPGEKSESQVYAASPQIQYLQNNGPDPREAVNLRASYQRDFRNYARVLDQLGRGETVSDALRLDLENSLNNTRQKLMSTVWDENWGEYSEFDRWLKRGCPEPAPKNIESAAYFFQGK